MVSGDCSFWVSVKDSASAWFGFHFLCWLWLRKL
jgi:hypothetical protein